MIPFLDRRDAGRQLGELLSLSDLASPVVVFGLPRGGIPVAYEVSERLRASLDVFVVRKLGAPGHPELAMGAIASGGIVVRNDDVIGHLRIAEQAFDRVRIQQQALLEATEKRYRKIERAMSARGTTCVIVDDGIATGATMRAAVIALRSQNPISIIVAAPVASPSAPQQFWDIADRVVLVHTPADFSSVGSWYMNFDQTTDNEVSTLLYNRHLQ